MSCDDCGLTAGSLRGCCANDDTCDPFSAAELMGATLWLDYVERWNPLRWVPARKPQPRRERRA